MVTSKEISILKLVIDLIKVDNRIHKDEISYIERLTAQYKYSEEELKAVHNITLHEAISTLQQLDITERNNIIGLLEEIIASDNNIDLCERILLASIQLALKETTCQRVQIITVDTGNFDGYDNQLIYLEQRDYKNIKNAIKQNFDYYYRELKNLGIDFFFYPHIARQLIQSHSYITPTIELLFPTFSHISNNDKTTLIEECSATDLYNFINKSMGNHNNIFRFKSFLLLKIQNSNCNGQHAIDFICIDCSNNTQEIIEELIKSLTFKITEESIPYEGCYRTLFEMFSEKSKHEYPLLLNGFSYYLKGDENIELDIKGSERKTLFTLFLLYGIKGISNAAFASLTKDSPMGRDIITIYRYFANEKSYEQVEEALQRDEEPNVIINLRDISKRNSHIGYIKRAFTSIPSLQNAAQYYPQNIKGEYSYNILLNDNMKMAKHHTEKEESILTISFFK